MKRFVLLIATFLSFGVATATAAVSADGVITHYADLAHAKYSDSLTTAKALRTSIDALLRDPGQAALEGARAAWLAARIPYLQSEVYRFGNPIVDDWEGRINAWPLDEGLIDYVDAGYGKKSVGNSLYTANIIANTSFTVNGKTIDASEITPDFIQNQLHEAGGIEANVASGYHAVEFLLWGQDLNGNEAGSGNRPYTDFSLEDCTNGHCDRRRQYLAAVSDLLVSDLEEMAANWAADGAARKSLLARGQRDGLKTILIGMGSLSYGELAGERIKLGLLLGDPEEEEDCFSDNTHNAHYYSALGIQNVYLGTYKRIDGSTMDGPSLAAWLAQQNADLDTELKAELAASVATIGKIVARAENVEAYDQMIAPNNEAGHALLQAAIDALGRQTRSIERAMKQVDFAGTDPEDTDLPDRSNAVFR